MKLFEKPGYETIIGDGRHLTEYMQNLIKGVRFRKVRQCPLRID